MNNTELITNWVLRTVEEHYYNDIALVVSHTTLRINESENAVSYFVPITERGESFGRTFLLDGVGHDLWGVSWERLERFAKLEEYNITCLADGKLLYARTPEDRERFETLKQQQAKNLANRPLMRKNALEAYVQAKNIYLEMLFSVECDSKMAAGYVLDYLAQAVAFTNLCYFKHSQVKQLEELSHMQKLPDGFLQLYRDVIFTVDPQEQKKLCGRCISLIQTFLDSQSEAEETKKATSHNRDYQALADWYAELSYTWLRIRYYARSNSAIQVYQWGCMLQQELNCVCEDYGLNKMQLMNCFDPVRLLEFSEHADRLEAEMRSIITQGGGIIHEYQTAEEFLREV